MKINVENEEKIKAAINAAQEKANARTVTYKDVITLVEKSEKWLQGKGIPKSFWVGSSFSFAEKVSCNSYNKKSFTADSTIITVLRGTRDWFLINVRRISLLTKQGNGSDYSVNLSQPTREKAKEIFAQTLWVM